MGNAASVPVTNPDFYVWHLRVLGGTGADLGRLGRTVQADLVSAGPRRLNEGDQAICSTVAGIAGITAERVAGWQVARFATPYYSDHREASDLARRLVPAWRLEIRLSAPQAPSGYLFTGPVPITGQDSTWRPRLGAGLEASEDVRVIADGIRPDGAPDRWLRTADVLTARLPESRVCHHRFEFAGGVLHQFEVDLGPVRITGTDSGERADAEGRIADALAACEEAGLETWVRRTDLSIARLRRDRAGAIDGQDTFARQDARP